MTAQEMVNRLRLAMGDEVEPYTVSTAVIFQWLSDAYLRIQLESEQWKFYHNRGLLITTVNGTAEYTISQVREIYRDSIYRNKVGETTRFPMEFMEYSTWVQEQQVGIQREGDPLFIVPLPDFSYRIEPIPTAAWEIRGDIWYKPSGFSNLSSSPIWDDEYHSLVIWEALKVASLEFADSKKVARMQANLSVNLVPMRRAFNYRYLESKRGACPLL